MPRLWMSALGGEVRYQDDLPACCQRAAHSGAEFFECVSCGAAWQETIAAEPEECAFTERVGDERKGAA